MHTPLKLHHRTDAELAASLNQTLSDKQDTDEGVWLFVYGLLAKQPPFVYTRAENMTLKNWHRRFNLADPMNRGTPHAPGLTLGLEEGGATEGVAYYLPPSAVRQGLAKVWEQEMLLPFYTPQWVVHEDRKVLVMLTDPASPALVNKPKTEIATIIQASSGKAGTNHAYLTDVINAFADHAIEDPYLATINTIVQANHPASRAA